MILNRWFQLGVAITVTAVVGVVVGVLIAGSGTVSSVREVAGTVATGELTDESEFLGPVVLTTGASIPYIVAVKGEAGRPARDATDIALPLTAAEVVVAGWTDPILCSVGRGRDFQKGTVGEGDPAYYVLAHLR